MRFLRAKHSARFSHSPHFDKVKRKFLNRSLRDPWNDMEWFPMLKEWHFGKQFRRPTQPLPHLKPDFEKLTSATDGISCLWLGHSTVFLNLGGKTILVDPVFADSIAPVMKSVSPRFQPRPFEPQDLGRIDFIVISHDHRDHLDADYICTLINTPIRFVVPLGIGMLLEKWGIPEHRITELDWWSSQEIDGVKWTCTPAQHLSGRGLLDGSLTLWSSWVIECKGQKIFYSGDTGYSQHFEEIGERLGPFQLALIECGQYNKWWHYLHLLPEEVVQVAQELRAENFLPVHWGMFNLALHDWFEPVELVSRFAEQNKVSLLTPQLGEFLRIGEPVCDPTWWRRHPDFIKREALREPKSNLRSP